ncbi:malonic semialdehyde reductase [Myxococcus sp. AB036A]|uniref:malonic semialdehyde reductase n=1 Tax=Myxococcus sp. AB036A TaxID=2562793 RepID=UPI00114657FF|nr:malonic semialdehyde reductase [Myxococcus sp. AB036A]
MATQQAGLDANALNQLFLDARTHNAWLDKPVADDVLQQLYALTRMAPTAANSQPVRIVFVKSREAKERLKPTLSPGNVDKTMNAPVTAIIAYDTAFYEKFPQLFPSRDMKAGFLAMPAEAREKTAHMNSSLHMAGFDNAKLDAAFFPEGKWKSNFLINLGYGDAEKLFPRNPRLDFSEACRIE